MRASNICAFIFATSLLLSVPAWAQKDTSVRRPVRQLRLGVDVSRLVANALLETRTGYELQADYHLRKDLYAVLEGGWGSANYDFPDLSYKSTNIFARIGVDKGMLPRLTPGDWDMAFIGLRYGVGVIDRGEATFTTTDPIWGSTSGTVPSKAFTAHWGEVTGGVRVELYKGIFAGWNVRAKFMMNANAFKELPPSYIAGYGRGDRSTMFDFNFYLSYALRW